MLIYAMCMFCACLLIICLSILLFVYSFWRFHSRRFDVLDEVSDWSWLHSQSICVQESPSKNLLKLIVIVVCLNSLTMGPYMIIIIHVIVNMHVYVCSYGNYCIGIIQYQSQKPLRELVDVKKSKICTSVLPDTVQLQHYVFYRLYLRRLVKTFELNHV